VATLPPELMTPERREQRAAEVEHEIGRQWLTFVWVEAVVLWVPITIFVLAYVFTDAIDDSLLPVAVGFGIAISVALTLYWVLLRIRPRQRELEALRGGGR
jgi:hypothetical protein